MLLAEHEQHMSKLLMWQSLQLLYTAPEALTLPAEASTASLTYG